MIALRGGNSRFWVVLGANRLRNSLAAAIAAVSLAQGASLAAEAAGLPPFYPIGLYCVDDPRDMPDIAAAGFNLVQSYRFEGLPPWGKTDAEATAYLDAAGRHGLRVLTGIPQEAVSRLDLPLIRRRVRASKDHPALWGYMLYDEPENPGYGRGQALPPGNFDKACRAVKQADGSHPILTTANGAVDDSYPYLGVDMMLLQYSLLPPGSYDPPWDSLEHLGEAHESSFATLAAKGKPFLFTVQAYNLANDPDMWPDILQRVPTQKGRYPTREEMRFIAYSGIVRGARGIVFVCYKTFDENGAPLEDVSLKNNSSQWKAVASVSAELKALMPVLLAPDSDAQVNSTLGVAGSAFSLKAATGVLYLIAVNPHEQKRMATFTFTNALATVKRWHETGEILPRGASFADEFDGYGVHVYEVRQ